MHNELLARAKKHAESRVRMGGDQPKLVKHSLELLINEIGSQKNAAKLISDFYGIRKSQGTISKARNGAGDVVLVCNELRCAIGTLRLRDFPTEAKAALTHRFDMLPTYHDFFKHNGESVIYAGCSTKKGLTYMTLYRLGDKTPYDAPMNEVEAF